MTRPAVCPSHHLVKVCPACQAQGKPNEMYPALDVPRGTAQWLYNAARVWAGMGDEGAVAFCEWISVDLREVA